MPLANEVTYDAVECFLSAGESLRLQRQGHYRQEGSRQAVAKDGEQRKEARVEVDEEEKEVSAADAVAVALECKQSEVRIEQALGRVATLPKN